MFPLFCVMNYFIMFTVAVIKCVLFYDDGVIEGRCNKSCLGHFFLLFHWMNVERLNKRWAENMMGGGRKGAGGSYNSLGTPQRSDLKTEQVSHSTAVNCVLSGDSVE